MLEQMPRRVKLALHGPCPTTYDLEPCWNIFTNYKNRYFVITDKKKIIPVFRSCIEIRGR